MKTGLELTQEIFDLWIQTYKDTYGKLVEIPALGPLREKQEKLAKDFSASVNLYTAMTEFNINFFTVILEANRRTYEKILQERLTKITEKENKEDFGYKEFFSAWIETYSETFKEFLKSGHFSSDIGKLTANLIDFQKYNKEVIEENFLKPLKLPTTTEVDEINKEIYSVKKTLKELSKHIEDIKTQTNVQIEDIKTQTNAQIEDIKTQTNAQIEDIKTKTNTQIEDIKTQKTKTNTQIEDIKTKTNTQIEDIKTKTNTQIEDIKTQTNVQIEEKGKLKKH